MDNVIYLKSVIHFLTFKHEIMIVRIINAILIVFAACMGIKQGYAMVAGKPEMMEMFGKWGFNKTALVINGSITIIAALLILFPKTFVWGNFLMAAGILLIICLHLLDKDLKGVLIELPFLILNLAVIYLQYPLKNA